MKSKFGAVVLLAVATSVCVPYSAFATLSSQDGYHEHEDWDTPPAEYHEIGRRGFHDGVEGARKDFENHRKPNVNNRDEYRHPPVSKEDRDEYRAAFHRGYDAGVEHLMNGVR